MCLRFSLTLPLLLLACATSSPPDSREPLKRSPRLANLQRAAALPWRDEGHCVVREASRPWPAVVEACFHALDSRRIQFQDTERRCPVVSTDAAALRTMVGICLLTQPELAVGAVVIVGVVIVAVAIREELDVYALKRGHPEDLALPDETKTISREPSEKRRPAPEESPSGRDRPPPVPPEPPGQEESPECTPKPVPHRGGHDLHNRCADAIPDNNFSGGDVLVRGKRFDALQLRTRTLWEVKTNVIATYNAFVLRMEMEKQVEEARRERGLAASCGFHFRIGVHSEAHKAELVSLDDSLDVVVMDWC